ncbi:MAG: hypothetical protein JNL81_05495 [Hyphomonadaceae bacterium]|nr:hypothetical protein [Hyphomonadaceae bacterium]
MKTSTSLAMAAALSAGLMAGNAAAQDMRDFDSLNNARASEGEAVRVRLTIPFQREAEQRDTRVSFALQQGDGEGRVRNLDMFSFSLTGDAPPQLETPFALGAADGDGFFSKPMNWVWIGLGVGAAYWLYEESQDDDDPAPQIAQ